MMWVGAFIGLPQRIKTMFLKNVDFSHLGEFPKFFFGHSSQLNVLFDQD